MKRLFINAAFREGSRTKELADYYLRNKEYETIDLGTLPLQPLMKDSLKIYNDSVSTHTFDHSMFDVAKEFITADEIVIAAPFYNYSFPACLHTYVELVCTQGISFDIDENGVYHSLCKAKKLVYITTAGGPLNEENDFAYHYLYALCKKFWMIEEVIYYKADNVDLYGIDVEKQLNEVKEKMD